MNRLLRSILNLVTILGLAGGAAYAQSQEDNFGVPGERTKSWVGKSGNLYHHRLDSRNRILSIKRERSKSPGLELKYEGHSRKPVAVRLAGRTWRYIAPTIVSQNLPSSIGLREVRSVAVARTEFEQPHFSWTRSPRADVMQAFNSPSVIKKFTLKPVVDSDDGYYDEDMAAVEDLELFVSDQDDSYFLEYDSFAPTPEEKAKCIDGCDRWDWAMVVCAFAAEAPPVAAACVALMTYGKQECKRKCL